MKKFPDVAKKTAIILGLIAVFLAIASLTGQHYKLNGGNDSLLLKLVDKFDLDGEGANFPTWFQSSIMLFCAFLLALISYIRREIKGIHYRVWQFLAVVFLYLSLDETVCIHEQATMPLRNLLHAEGILYFSWVIPAGIVVLLFLAYTIKLLRDLPVRVRWRFIAAGTIYLSGAIVMEMVGAKYYETHIARAGGVGEIIDWTYAVITTIEESLESIGLIVFAFSLLSHLSSAEVHEPVKSRVKSYHSLKNKLRLNAPAVFRINTK